MDSFLKNPNPWLLENEKKNDDKIKDIMPESRIIEIETRIGHTFRNKSLLLEVINFMKYQHIIKNSF